MTDGRVPDHDLEWYESRWEELMEVLSVSDPEAVVDEIRGLQERVESRTSLHDTLTEAGVEDPERILQMLENMTNQLEELYAERDPRGESHVEHTTKSEEHSRDG